MSRSARAPSALDPRSVPYAVIDVETTGFSPDAGHRVVEVAIVRVRPSGRIEAEVATLVNPERHVGATSVHGIRSCDVADAPRFCEVIGDVAQLMTGAVLVAHNATFDLSFLRAEFRRAGLHLPPWPTLCTLRLASMLIPAPRLDLAGCCEALGIDVPRLHTALDDARATAYLLIRLLRLARRRGIHDLGALGCHPTRFPAVRWPPVSPSGRSVPRGSPKDAYDGARGFRGSGGTAALRTRRDPAPSRRSGSSSRSQDSHRRGDRQKQPRRERARGG